VHHNAVYEIDAAINKDEYVGHGSSYDLQSSRLSDPSPPQPRRQCPAPQIHRTKIKLLPLAWRLHLIGVENPMLLLLLSSLALAEPVTADVPPPLPLPVMTLPPDAPKIRGGVRVGIGLGAMVTALPVALSLASLDSPVRRVAAPYGIAAYGLGTLAMATGSDRISRTRAAQDRWRYEVSMSPSGGSVGVSGDF